MMSLIHTLDALIEAGAARITAVRQARCGHSKRGHRYVYAPVSTRAARGTRGHYLDFLGDRYACAMCGKELRLLRGADGATREVSFPQAGTGE